MTWIAPGKVSEEAYLFDRAIAVALDLGFEGGP